MKKRALTCRDPPPSRCLRGLVKKSLPCGGSSQQWDARAQGASADGEPSEVPTADYDMNDAVESFSPLLAHGSCRPLRLVDLCSDASSPRISNSHNCACIAKKGSQREVN
jgi:hypothetical protein